LELYILPNLINRGAEIHTFSPQAAFGFFIGETSEKNEVSSI